MSSAGRWILGPPPDRRARVRLFAFPYAGAGASAFLPWRPALATHGIDLAAVQLPGRESRFNEPVVTSLPDLVARVCDAIAPHADPPFALFGHSMGAVIAYEVARALQRRGARAERLIVSGSVAPHRRTAESLHTLPPAEFIETVSARYNGIPREVLEHEELLRIAAPILQADFALLELYRFEPAAPLDARIAALGGDADPSVPPPELDVWRELTAHAAAFRSRVFRGDHFYLHEQREGVLEEIAGLL